MAPNVAFEADLYDNGGGESLWMSPSLHVPRDKLMAAITNVETLCEWLEEKMLNAQSPTRHDSVPAIVESPETLGPTMGTTSTDREETDDLTD